MKKKGNLHQLLYTSAMLLLSFKLILDASALFSRPEWFDDILNLTFVALIIGKLLMQTYTVKTLCVDIIIGLICVLGCLKTKYFYIIFSFLLIISIQDVDIKQVLKYTCRLKFTLLCIHMIAFSIAYVFGIGELNVVVRNGIERYSFYLGHPNTFSAYFVWTSLELLYVHYDRLKVPQFIGIWLLNLLIYKITNSNTSIIVATLVIGLAICDKKRMKLTNALTSFSARYGFLICSIIFPGICMMYLKLSGKLLELFYITNGLLTGRLLYGVYAYNNYGYSLFGRTVSYPQKSYWNGMWFDEIYFDNAYIGLFVQNGIIFLVLLSFAFWFIGKKTRKMEQILIVGLVFYGVMEAYVTNAAICFPILFIGKYMVDGTPKFRCKGEEG